MAAPSQTLPPGGATGKPGFPTPLRTGCALPHLPAGGGMGKPGFPIPLREGVALPNPPAGGGVGEPGSPRLTLDLLAAVGGPTGSRRAAPAAPPPDGDQERSHSETIVLAVRAQRIEGLRYNLSVALTFSRA